MQLSTCARSDMFRFLLRALPFLTSLASKATTYYVSPSGNDANSGTSQAQAWQTISRVNQLSFGFQPGDQILFQRGGSYNGTLLIASSGTSAQPIAVGAYGSGTRPTFTGAQTVTSWTVHSGNIWKAPFAQSPTYLFVNDALMTLARYPNSGWLTNDNGSSTTITDAALTQANGYWVGAKAVIRSSNYTYHAPSISGFSNSTLTYTDTYYNLGSWNWGYFLCNKLSELDMPGEWYYDAATAQCYLWAPGNANPNGLLVEGSTTAKGILLAYNCHHIQIGSIAFEDFTDVALSLETNTNVVVNNCTFDHCYIGLRAGGSNNTYTANTFQGIFGTAMFLMDNNVLVQDNTFTDIAMVPGLGEDGWGYFGIRTTGSGVVLRSNRLTNVGYIGIVAEQNALIEKNVLDNMMAIMNDGSAIAFDHSNGMVIQDNIVRTVVGDMTSSASNSPYYYAYGHGIYFGNTSLQNTIVQRNTVTGCSGHGVHMDHTPPSAGNQVKDNVLYGNRVQLCLSDASGLTYSPAFNDVVSDNVLYCTDKDQLCMLQYNVFGTTPVDFGTYSNNLYLNPYDEVSIFYFNTFSGQQTYYTLEEWQADRTEDLTSSRSSHRFNAMEAVSTIGPMMTPNGSFDYNVNGWIAFPGNVSLTHDQTYLDNGAMKAHMPNNSLYNDMVLNGPDQLQIQNGSWYRVRVSTQSNVLGQVNVRIKGQTEMTGPYATYERKVPFGPVRRDVELFFQSDLTDQALVQLMSHYTDPTYWIDNIEVQQVQVAPIDPSEQQILLINDDAAVQTFNLTGCWSDVYGTLHTGSIDVPAYGSVVLVKEDDADCSLSTGVETGEPTGSGTAFLFPNPVQASGIVRSADGFQGGATLALLDLNGRQTKSATPVAGRNEWLIPADLTPGVYIAQLTHSGGIATQRLIVGR